MERGRELLDAAASDAFAVPDHQLEHIYINNPQMTARVRCIVEKIKGVELVLDNAAQKQCHIDHERSGDLVLVADEKSWFTYYFWLDDNVAPDYARSVDIHKKPGYDPVEMFMTSKSRAAYKLLRKKLGFRYVMDVIPIDAALIKGAHGRIGTQPEFHPILTPDVELAKKEIMATDVANIIWKHLTQAKF